MFRPKTASDDQALETRVLYNLYDSLTIGQMRTFIYSISVKTRNAEKSAEIILILLVPFSDRA